MYILIQGQLSKVTLSELQIKLQLSFVTIEYIMQPANLQLLTYCKCYLTVHLMLHEPFTQHALEFFKYNERKSIIFIMNIF